MSPSSAPAVPFQDSCNGWLTGDQHDWLLVKEDQHGWLLVKGDQHDWLLVKEDQHD